MVTLPPRPRPAELAEGAFSIALGVMAGSISLVGFGVDGVIEVSSSIAALWRRYADADPKRRARMEAITSPVGIEDCAEKIIATIAASGRRNAEFRTRLPYAGFIYWVHFRRSVGQPLRDHMVDKGASVVVFVLLAGGISTAAAQHSHSVPDSSAAPAILRAAARRSTSGTAWLPDSTKAAGWHSLRGPWSLSLHGNAFGQYSDQSTVHGDRQLGLTDWEMIVASRTIGAGIVELHAMTSLEAAVLGSRGYPLLLQTGQRLANRQAPRDGLMELSARYDHAFGRSIAASVYAAPVGEPAVGPVAFMHRPSAQDDPTAPLGHHWQDATHAAVGVVTAGIFSRFAKLEGSVFNGRQSDTNRFRVDIEGARLDSYAGRFTVAPTGSTTASVWWAYIADHERDGAPMHRYGAQIMTQRPGVAGGDWTTTAIFGANVHHHIGPDHSALHGGNPASPHQRSNSLLLESAVGIGHRLSVFGRIERVQKSASELGFLGGDLTQRFDVRPLSLGTRIEVVKFRRLSVGVGGRAAVTLLPETLRYTYGTRRPTGYSIYLNARPVTDR